MCFFFFLSQSPIPTDKCILVLTTWTVTSPDIVNSNLSIIGQLPSLFLPYPNMLFIQPHLLALNTPAFLCSFLSPFISPTHVFASFLPQTRHKHITSTTVFLLHLTLQFPNLGQPNYLLCPIFICHSAAHCCPNTFRISKLTWSLGSSVFFEKKFLIPLSFWG